MATVEAVEMTITVVMMNLKDRKTIIYYKNKKEALKASFFYASRLAFFASRLSLYISNRLPPNQ